MALTQLDLVTVGAGGASSITFSSIDQTYGDLLLIGRWKSALTSGNSVGLSVRANGISTASYRYNEIWTIGNYAMEGYSTTGSSNLITQNGFDVPTTTTRNANTWCGFQMNITDYTASQQITADWEGGWWNGDTNASYGDLNLKQGVGQTTFNGPITSLTFALSSGNIAEGSWIALYGNGA